MRRYLLLLALAAGCAGAQSSERPHLELVGSFDWREGDARFGGFSGIEITDKGGVLTALSDRGTLWRASVSRDGATITAIESAKPRRLADRAGGPLDGKRLDAEGLAIGTNGRVFASFEGTARVAEIRDGVRVGDLPRHPDFEGMQNNSSLEALAVDQEGALYTLPERSGQVTRPFPLYRWDESGWTIAGQIPRRPPFLPVGADFGPDGWFYLLERDFTGIGFRSRIRRFDPDFGSEETLLETGSGEHDNLEGISVWRDGTGATILSLISDDNFRFFQSTQIVEYRLLR